MSKQGLLRRLATTGSRRLGEWHLRRARLADPALRLVVGSRFQFCLDLRLLLREGDLWS